MAKDIAEKKVKEQPEVILLKDSEWSIIDQELCRVIDFVPFGSVRNGEVLALDKSTPYASITFVCEKLSGKIKGFITHKIDFMHLWMVFKERKIEKDEEVIIVWTKKLYKGFAKLSSAIMPKLQVMICKKGAFKLMTNPNYKPDLRGQARYLAERPIVLLKPEVMK